MEKLLNNRTGLIIKQQSGYDAFMPKKLSEEEVNLNIDAEMLRILSEADRALGELKGVTETLPNPNLFIAFYVQKEAILSSQIEGTQCSLDEILQVDQRKFEIKPVTEVVNYIKAMDEGLNELKDFPMNIRLLKKIHKILLQNVRGKERTPGEFKKQQNWVGPAGCNLNEAIYIPPPPDMMIELMGDWEVYYHKESKYVHLIKAAIMHSHFETIHPFIDGNGRLGRLLITFMLCEKKVLNKPILYLSLFFKENKTEYYQMLMDVRFKGTWEEWIKFFLRGIRNTSKEAIQTAKDILSLQQKHTALIKETLSKYRIVLSLFNLICKNPIISIPFACKELDVSYPTVKKTIDALISKGILVKYNDMKRKKLFVYSNYLDILKRGT